jgi:hypothetical protein
MVDLLSFCTYLSFVFVTSFDVSSLLFFSSVILVGYFLSYILSVLWGCSSPLFFLSDTSVLMGRGVWIGAGMLIFCSGMAEMGV